jgi:hypothetical protein
MSSLLERVVAVLFGNPAAQIDGADRQLVEDTTEAFVETVEPRVRLRSGYREKLAGNVSLAIAHLRELGRMPLQTVVLSRAAWSQDPHVRAFFAAADDLPTCIGRSDEVREFFETHPECAEAWALMGMQRKDRQILGPRLEGEVLRQDVAQTTVSFTGHRLLAPTPDMAQTKLEIGRRIMQRLAELVLARIVGINQQTQDLSQSKALLGVQLRRLHRARDGMESLVIDGTSIEQQIRDVERQLKETAEGYVEAKSSLATLDSYIDQINAVLAHPEQQVSLAPARLRVNRMGVKVDEGSSEEADDLDLAELSIGEGLHATISLVRIPRTELPAKQDLLAQAQRAL